MNKCITLFIFFFGSVTSIFSATINVNIVGWSFLSPSFDTTITASPGDSLIIFNSTTGYVGFNKEINNIRVDTLPGVPVGDTADVHVLSWNQLTLGYYIETQIWNQYGLRCHISFLNAGLTSFSDDFNLSLTHNAIVCNTNLSGIITVYNAAGSIVAFRSLPEGSSTIEIGNCSGILIAEVLLSDGSIITRKFLSAAN
jgi:hypothetical protein